MLSTFAEQGYIVLENQISPEEANTLVALGHSTYPMQPAGTGRGGQYQQGLLRGDRIHWLDDQHPVEQRLFERFKELRQMFNQAFYLGLDSTEAHLACYTPGKGYAKHKDTFNDQRVHQRRRLSSVLYLNPEWQATDGGQLRLYPKGEASIDVVPQLGRLVVFLSEEMEHEVLPAHKDRWSIAAWHLTR